MSEHSFIHRTAMGDKPVVDEWRYDALAARLAEAHQLLQDALIYGCDGQWAKRLAAHLGAADSAEASR
jgi:hypothetical protein